MSSTGTPPVRRDRRRVRRGSVSLSLHVLIEYGVAVLMIVAPFLFSFDATAAELASVLVGAGILVLAVLTDAPTGIARSLPVASHVVLDYVLGLFFIVAPFVLGFSGRRRCRDRVLHRARARLRAAGGADPLPRPEARSLSAPAGADLSPAVAARARRPGRPPARADGCGRAARRVEGRAQRPARAAGAGHRRAGDRIHDVRDGAARRRSALAGRRDAARDRARGRHPRRARRAG